MSRLWLLFSNIIRTKSFSYLAAPFRRIVFICGLLLTILFIFSLRDFRIKDYDSDSPNGFEALRYAVVIDAGSSGSRAFVYVWPPHNGNPKELLSIEPLKNTDGSPKVMKIEPGLSSFADSPRRASDYISPLLRFAAQNIPPDHHRETPLYILATAGMRLLNATHQTAILDDLKTHIPKRYNFSFTETNIEIISGKQEGVYQWIAINYVLGRFDHKSDAPLVVVDVSKPSSDKPLLFRKQTTGIMDMGGASMQIAFEIVSRVQLEQMQETTENNIAEFNLGCLEHGTDHLYRTFVTTYLGLGANEAFDVYNDHLLNVVKKNFSERASGRNTLLHVYDPCRPLELLERINWTVPNLEPNYTLSRSVVIQVKGTGDYNKCRSKLLPILSNLTGCPGSNCVFSKLPIDFISGQFYGFSEFWYSLEDVLRIGGRYNFYTLQKAAQDFCATRWPVLKARYQSHLYPLADLHRFRTQCFKSSWIAVVLHDGLGFDQDFSQLQSSPNTIGGKVAHWTLGAVLYRTRYFPLGDVQRENKLQLGKSNYFPYSFYLNSYWLIACFLLVCGAILLYLRRLHCLHPNHVISLKTFSHSKADDLEIIVTTERNMYR